MDRFIKNVAYALLFVGLAGTFFILLAKPKEVAGYFDPIVFYSDVVFLQTGEKKCKTIKAGNQQGKLVKVDCGIFTAIQLAKMDWKPAY